MSRPKINTSKDGRCGYIVFGHNGQQAEVYANSQFAASELGRKFFKTPKSKSHLVHSVLCEQDGKQVTHSTSEV